MTEVLTQEFDPSVRGILEEVQAIEAGFNSSVHWVEDDGGRQPFQIGHYPVSAEVDSELTIVRHMPWSEHVTRRFEQRRSAVMAAAMGAEVYTVSFPGMSPDLDDEHDRLTPFQKETLLSRQSSQIDSEKRSSFIPVASAANKALIAALLERGLPLDYLEGRATILNAF